MLIPFPSLPSLKGRCPFRLGTTSYILPDAIVPNVRFTGPFVDEVELVLFESRFEDNLPTPKVIEELHGLAREYDLSYNVHLPTDVFLGHPDAGMRRQACDTILSFYGRTLPLRPTSYLGLARQSPLFHCISPGTGHGAQSSRHRKHRLSFPVDLSADQRVKPAHMP